MQNRTPQRLRSGFTLVELMVALALSSLLMGAVYSTFMSSTSVFQTQEDIAAAQYQLRTGLDQVLSDLRRAGFGTTPNSDADPTVCVWDGSSQHGLLLDDGASAEVVPWGNETNPNIAPDQLVLKGNFSSGRPFPALANAVSRTLSLQVSEAGGQGAYAPGSILLSRAEFARAFVPGRMVAVRNDYGYTYLTRLDAANYPNLTVVDLANGGPGCGVQGVSAVVQVSPVDTLRYRIVRRNDQDPNDARTELLREFLDAAGNPLPNQSIIVAHNPVDLQIWFMFRDPNPGSRTIPPDDPTDTLSNLNIPVDGQAGARPELIRSAIVRLALRTDMEHEDITHRPRSQGTEPLVTFDVDRNLATGAAPVVSLTGEVELPNFALREIAP